MAERLVGAVTFLFTDIEGSTELAHELGTERWGDVLQRHAEIIRAAVAQHDGVEVRTEGDSFFLAFQSARQAVAAAADAQRAFATHQWPHGASVRVRMGMHTGEGAAPGTPEMGTDYVGYEVHRAARVSAAGHGGQVLLSSTTTALLSDNLPSGVAIRDLGEHRLKDVTQPERLYQLVIEGLPKKFPPLHTLVVGDTLSRPPIPSPVPDPKLPRLTGVLSPAVNAVARIHASVHTKLLAAFLAGAVLLLGMALLSLVVIGQMSARVGELNRLQDKVDRTRQMQYAVTAQMHYRAMALLTQDNTNNDKIALAKQSFAQNLNVVESLSPASERPFFDKIREANSRFDASGSRILVLYDQGKYQEGLKVHLAEEHPISHELEAALGQLATSSTNEMAAAEASFSSDRQLLLGMVGVFSVASLFTALLLGFVLSWSLIRPVKKIDFALAEIAAGDFGRRVEVPNRDEFGTLTRNLNTTTAQLARLYEELRSLSATLQQKVDEQLQEIKRAAELKRYLAPQLAESILAGTVDVSLVSRRKNLTIFFSDIRGFTAMSERAEPEELVDSLNEYLTAMTEIVFKYGGTLDKYLGDGIMVFLGDPIAYEDHAVRAVKMALEMRARLAELRRRWVVELGENLVVGMGISTGYVTVGNIGSAARMEYTVLGNHVNLASRMAGKALAGQILVGERTLAACRDLVEAKEIDQIALEGVSRPVKIYEINEKTN